MTCPQASGPLALSSPGCTAQLHTQDRRPPLYCVLALDAYRRKQALIPRTRIPHIDIDRSGVPMTCLVSFIHCFQ